MSKDYPIGDKRLDRAINAVVNECRAQRGIVRTVTKYMSPTMVVRGTNQHNKRRNPTVLLSVGRPNWSARQFIKTCIAAGETFPIRKLQYKFYPRAKPQLRKVKA